ncbi:tyrosine-protein phosphatase [Streptomyces sp. LHD-70]|uniref:tyrosine-protein phosphatase n=1 Tax=Streptomyces sp. LHD-70 TaxID=3072140 RepID=UPI00280D9681|nr:tyrosine-protein phosphatase [Streptomyces sp. LHD-70]MDQ8706060.1 tyrosine-protein phosphatase [Streptomyces sp. LHD-70]
MRTVLIRLATGVALSAATLGCLPASAVADAPAQAAVVTASPDRRSATDTVRQIALQGAVNVRDLGGYRTDRGRTVRYGQVFRADALGKLTDADVSKLAALELRTVVDFRVPLEVQRDGADRLPAGVAATSRSVDDLGTSARVREVIGSKDPVQQQELLGDGKAEELMRSIYRTFVTSPETRSQFAETLRNIADKRSPLLYHCTSGKDRTGWMSYLLLRTVGVPAATAEKDYLLSNDFRAEADRRAREGLKQAGYMENPDLLIPLLEVREDYLRAALDQAEQDYGSLDGYLTDGLGLDTATLARLRARLLR